MLSTKSLVFPSREISKSITRASGKNEDSFPDYSLDVIKVPPNLWITPPLRQESGGSLSFDHSTEYTECFNWDSLTRSPGLTRPKEGRIPHIRSKLCGLTDWLDWLLGWAERGLWMIAQAPPVSKITPATNVTYPRACFAAVRTFRASNSWFWGSCKDYPVSFSPFFFIHV